PKNWTVGPLIARRSVNDQGEGVIGSILHDEWTHLFQNTLANFILLVAEFFLQVLLAAFQGLLLLLNLPLQIALGVVVHLVALVLELVSQTLKLIVHVLELSLLRLQLLGSHLTITLALVAGENCGLNVNGPYLCSAGGCNRGRGRRAGGAGRRGQSRGSRRIGLGQGNCGGKHRNGNE